MIAIIAILAGMLLPALSQARERGKSITCTGNLRQLMVGYLQYTTDNNEYQLPTSYNWGIGGPSNWTWKVHLAPYMGFHKINNSAIKPESMYNNKVFCTGAFKCTTWPLEGIDGNYGGYAHNWGVSCQGYRKMNLLKRLSETVGLTETMCPIPHAETHLYSIVDMWTAANRTRVAHLKGWNMGFLDGRVSYLTRSQVENKPYMPGVRFKHNASDTMWADLFHRYYFFAKFN